jgi:hypothetical protein
LIPACEGSNPSSPANRIHKKAVEHACKTLARVQQLFYFPDSLVQLNALHQVSPAGITRINR